MTQTVQYKQDPNVFKDYCVRVFSHMRPNATFLTIRNYLNNFGERSNFNVCFHINYFNAVEKAHAAVRSYTPAQSDCSGFTLDDLFAARQDLLWSYDTTMSGKDHPLYTCSGVYEDIIDHNGRPVPGVKLHSANNELHINALKIRKKVVAPTDYPIRNSAPFTLARRFLSRKTPLKDWVQFKLVLGRFDELAVEKMMIEGK